MRKSWLGMLGLTIASMPWSGAAAKAPKVQAAAELTCFQDDALATSVREQMGEAGSAHWRLALRAKAPSGLELILYYRGTKTGRRSFSQLPQDCPSQQRLVSTVAVLAMENWASRNEDASSPQTKPSGEDAAPKPANPDKPRKRDPKRKKSRPKPKPPGPTKSDRKNNPTTQAPKSEQERAATEGLDPASAPAQREESARPDASAERKAPRRRARQRAQATASNDPSERDSARLARDIARQQARARAKKRAPGPFFLAGGAGLGAAYGASANLGPQVDGWLAATRNRFAIRAGARLAYGLPRSLGPARLHSGLTGLTFELCLRPGRYAPSGAMEFWGCLGGMGAFVIARGQGSDDDRAGVRPVAGPTLTFELPLAQRGRHHWAIGVLGGLNLVRTRFDLRSSSDGMPLLHSYTMPAFHLSLQLRWRRGAG